MESLVISLSRSHFSQEIIVASNSGLNPTIEKQENGFSTSFDGGGAFVLPSEVVALYHGDEKDGPWWAKIEVDEVDNNGEPIIVDQFLCFEGEKLPSGFMLDLVDEARSVVWGPIYRDRGYGADAPQPADDWELIEKNSVPEEVQYFLARGITQVRESFGQGGDFFKPQPKVEDLLEEIALYKNRVDTLQRDANRVILETHLKRKDWDESFDADEDRGGVMLCPFCSKAQPLEVVEQIEFSSGYDSENYDYILGSIDADCAYCGRTFYRKTVDKEVCRW